MLSYKNVGCTGAAGSTVTPAGSVTCTDLRYASVPSLYMPQGSVVFVPKAS